MRIVQNSWTQAALPIDHVTMAQDSDIDLVLAFGSRLSLQQEDCFDSIRRAYPAAEILLCSTAGEIIGTNVQDDSIAITAMQFDKTKVRTTAKQLSTEIDHRAAGVQLANELMDDQLSMVLVFSDGQNVNGSQLVAGLNSVFEGRIPVIGGLAGDGANFESTLVGLNGPAQTGQIVAAGLYGSELEVRFGSQGGWEPFGPERVVTEATDNVLYKLDGQSALELYKTYLGDRAAELPGAALLFPLSFRLAADGPLVVRTIIGTNEADSSMTFAGNVPVGATARLMRAGLDRLIDGAHMAADACTQSDQQGDLLALLVSCVGRKLILNQRVEEEVEEVAQVLPQAAICGFYSYGELSPSASTGLCELHNQTMTITTISER